MLNTLGFGIRPVTRIFTPKQPDRT